MRPSIRRTWTGPESAWQPQGVKITLPATDLPSLGSRAILFLDPNGVTLEFCQKLK